MRLNYLFLLVLTAVLAAGCGESRERPPRVTVKIVNAAPGFSNLSIRRGTSSRAELATLTFPGSSASQVDSDTYTFHVETLDPITSNAIPRATYDHDLAAGQSHLHVLVEENETVVPLTFSRPIFDTNTPTWDATIVNAAEGLASGDIYITAPGTDLTSATALATVAFKDSFRATELTAGDFVVSVTAPGNPADVLFTSSTIEFQSGFSIELIVVPDVNGIDGVLSLILNANSSATFFDVNAPPFVRILNGAADQLPRDFYLAGDFTTPLAANVPYASSAPFLEVPIDTNRISATPAGNPSVIEGELNQALGQGTTYDVIASGNAGDLSMGLAIDERRRNNTHPKIMFVNAANYYDVLNIYLLPPGRDISTVLLPNWIVGSPSAIARSLFPEGTFELTIVDAVSRNVVLGPLELTMAPRGLYTIGLFDSGDGTTISPLFLDDFE